MSLQSVSTLAVVVVVLLCYIFCIIQAVSERTWYWKGLPYIVAMAPVLVHGVNHGASIETALAALFFLALTKAMIYLAAKEWGEQG